uniref:LRRCT domain-containing protein n=1 Tax=Salmo trutta TaxID=8032 RepID=A0A674E3D5_SALTR
PKSITNSRKRTLLYRALIAWNFYLVLMFPGWSMDISVNLFNDQTMQEMLCYGKGVLWGLRTLVVSRHNLQSFNNHLFTKLDKLTTINLSWNVFRSILDRCVWPQSLSLLNLSSSHLTKATLCLPKSLHVLDLSDNDLTLLNIELPLLTELYFSGNKFLSLRDGKLYLCLEVLSIRNNSLCSFSCDDLEGYNKLRVLEAGTNTFVCSCDFVAFMQDDMGHLLTLLDGSGAYVCESPDAVRGMPIVDARLSVFECHATLFLSLLCTSILMVFPVSGCLCYNCDALWYLKITWVWLRRPVLKRDDRWLRCLCNQYHRTLFVLSQNFVRSYWCGYEAALKLLEPIAKETIPKRFHKLLKVSIQRPEFSALSLRLFLSDLTT